MGNILRRFQTWLTLRVNADEVKADNIEADNIEADRVGVPQAQPPPNGTSTQDGSHGPATDPPPYSCQEFRSRELLEAQRLLSFELIASLSAAVCIAGVKGGPAAARAVADVLTHVSHAVAGVPAPEARLTAAIMTTAVTKYTDAATGRAEPGMPSIAVHEQALNSAPAASIPAISEHLPVVLWNIDNSILVDCSLLLRSELAPALILAVDKFTSEVASVAGYSSTFDIARTYSDLARRIADDVDKAFAGPGSSSSSRSASRTMPRGCDAVVQMTRLHTALYALRRHASELGHAPAVKALDALASSGPLLAPNTEGLYAVRCTCGSRPGECRAAMEVDRLRAVLCALWRYNTKVGSREAAEALAAVAAAAGMSPPSVHVCLDTGQDTGGCQAMVQTARDVVG